jgi:TPR repeat protein
MANPTQFRHYLIAQDAEGANVEVARSAEQVAVFAFDSKRQVFVHCHVLLDPLADRPGFEDRARKLHVKGHPLRARVLEYGEDDGSAFYITENVDGETVRAYLDRRENLPTRLAVKLTAEALRAADALLAEGDYLTAAPLEVMRILQTGAQKLAVVAADFRLVGSGPAGPAAGGGLSERLQFLKAYFNAQFQKGTLLDEAVTDAAEFREHLDKLLQSCQPGHAGMLADAAAEMESMAPRPPEGELAANLKPRPYLVGMLANFQEMARSISQTVRIQSQRLAPAQPYALRGMYMKTGQEVVVEQIPPRRLAGIFPHGVLRQVHSLPKAGKYPNLVPVVFIEHGDEVECMGETAVEGVALSELLESRGSFEPQETYVVLASVDAAIEQLEKAGIATQRMRLDDIYLFTGFGKEAPLDGALLTTKLNEWPGFSIVIRTHPCMHGMAGRGIDPGLLLPLPAPGPVRSGVEPIWNGGWMAALASFLMGMPDGQAKKHESGVPQTDTILALIEDELLKAGRGSPSPRQAFLTRYARMVQKYDTVSAPLPDAPLKDKSKELSGTSAAQGPAREMPKAAVVLPAKRGGPPPMPETGADGPHLGFAEALIQRTSGDFREEDLDEDIALPPMRSGMRVHGPVVESSWTSVRQKRPLWLNLFIVVAGALMVGALLAHFSGRASWQDTGGTEEGAGPVESRPDEVEAEPVAATTPPKSAPSLPPPVTPLVKELEKQPPPPPAAPAAPPVTPPAPAPAPSPMPEIQVATAIPVPANPALAATLQGIRTSGGQLTPQLRREAEKSAAGGDTEAMLALGRAMLRGEGGPADERGAFVWLEKAHAAGDPAALIPLAECYLQGWGTVPDSSKAVQLLEKAVSVEDAVAKDLLGVCLARGIGVDRDDERAFALCSEAYAEGVTSACGNLGALYLRGQGVAPDAERAVRLFAEGAGRGHAESMMLYAQSLEYGTGVLTNLPEATRWYQQAAKLGNAEAANWCRQKGVSF